MLRSLHIKDFAIIDDLQVEFGPGLNIMTGETGAGKTIIVEALKLILGGRAQGDAIRAGKERAGGIAEFETNEISAALKNCLERSNIDCGEGLIINRIISNDGRGKISVNGVPVTGSILREISGHLVDISSQHEHQILLDPSSHAGIVDAFGGLNEAVDTYRDLHQKWLAASRELGELKANERVAKEKLDYLKFQLQELSGADLKPNEDVEIEAERSRLKHAGALEEKTRAAEGLLYGGTGSATEQLDRAISFITQCSQIDSSASKWQEALRRVRGEAEDVARELSRYAEGLESNPSRFEELDERLHFVRNLMKKHGGSIESCIARRDEIAAEIGRIDCYDDIVAQKSALLEDLTKKRRAAAKNLSSLRKSAAEKLCKSMSAELKGLGMAKTGFLVGINVRDEVNWDETGSDAVEFLFSPNVGEPPKPLAKIASGGELSRVMLGLKGVLINSANLALTSIFDEVDSGIGGATAEVIGRKLKGVAGLRQVICITHLPQVAVYGDKHLKISKRVESGRTVAAVEPLPCKARIDEIARMLGGEKITNTTLAHAKEMFEQAIKG